MYDKKIKVEESAKNFVEATDNCIGAINKSCDLDMLMGMDENTFRMMKASMELVGTYKELCLKQAEAIDQLTELVTDLKYDIKHIDTRIDGLDKKVTDK